MITRERLEEIFEEDTRDWSLRRDQARDYIMKHLNAPTKRDDLLVFLFLDCLCPFSTANGTSDIVSGAEHDEIFIGVDPDDLAAAASEDDILALRDLGLRYSAEVDGFAMFA